ncbi:MAG TPA: amidohydrolase, partial [Thermodesulforhabdus norvegica]|nr:amidohydrolase [Thermodesulforhabdus norvegica]
MKMSEEVAFGKWLTELRRHFHKYPELGYQEIKTSQKIREILTELGVPFIYPVAETGVVAFLKARSDGPVRAFRTDMDALPIEEQNNVSYRSRHQGIMHACGHDGHMAIALGIVRKLVELKWTEKGRGKILFIFQPAEEGGAGAARMLESGALEDENVEAIYAFHLNPGLDLGKVGVAKDVSNAASDMFEIKVVGTGGHGAHPHVATDVILTTADVITKTHHIVSRSINALDSAVVSVGSVHAGSAPNVLPSEAVIAGTIRTFREEVRKHIQDTMKEICSG